MHRATELYEKIKKQDPLSSGNETLDNLLHGGFLPHLIYYIHGSKHILNNILLNTAVNFFLSPVDGGKNGFDRRIAYIDGLNRFNPYYISKIAVRHKIGVQHVLKNILVSRVFTWSQMVEVLQDRICTLDDIDLILVSGLTNMMNEEEDQREEGAQYQDLKKIFDGLNRSIEKFHPTIIMTGPRDPRSKYKPLGGNLLRHFSNIIIGIYEQERFIDIKLEQHPFMSYSVERFWIPLEIRQSPRKKKTTQIKLHNLDIRSFMDETKE